MPKRLFLFASMVMAAAIVLTSGQVRVDESLRAWAAVTAPAASGWSTPVNISNTAADSRLPVGAIDSKGRAYVTWVDWTGSALARNMMFNTNRSGQWASSTIVSPIYYDAIDDVGFPTIAVTPSGSSAYVAYHDADFSAMMMAIFYREYTNGAFKTEYPLNFSQTPVSCSYITLGMSPFDNTLYGIYMGDVSESFEMISRYRDGATGQWVGPELIPGQANGSKYTYQVNNLCIDAKGTAHAVYTQHTSAWYMKNPNPKNVNAWTAGIMLADTGLPDTYPKVAADDDGEAYVVWPHQVGGVPAIFLKKTVNGQWQATENVSKTSEACEYPTIAVHPKTKDIFVAWTQNIGGSKWQVMLKSYDATAKQWSVSANLSESSGDAGEPCLRIEPTGSLHLFYAEKVGSSAEIMYRSKLGAAAVGLDLVSPNGGENWQAFSQHNITWTTTGTVENVMIEYSTDGGITGTTLVDSTPNTGTYAWTVPNTPSNNCLVRVSSTADPTIQDTSEAPFTISPPPNALVLTSPNGGERWPATTTQNVTWTTRGTVPNVRIEVSTSGGTSYADVVASIPNTGAYAWAVPNTPSANCLVKISSPTDATISDTSDAPFTIAPPPKPFAPLSLGLDTRLDGTGTMKINALSWQANPANANIPLKNHRIYRKRSNQADSFYAFLAAVPGPALRYEDANLEVLQKYAYRVTALSTGDQESDPSSTVIETKKFEFPPLNLAVQTDFNRILFFQIKLNTITFGKNPLNDDAEVSGYNVYRRKAEEADSGFVLLATLNASTFRYEDGTSSSARLPVNQKYAYAVTTIYGDGRESSQAQVVTQR